MKILGLDLGSRAVKMVLMEENQILEKKVVSTMTFYRDYCKYDGKLTVDLQKLNFPQIAMGISTGYGRNNTDLKDFQAINEVKAHVYGAIAQTGWQDFILLDIGGQDVKVAKVEKGILNDLELNEKCAASCGRYLENMASVLEVSIEELSQHYEDPVTLNATCAVFSESELIGKIAEGIPLSRLCAGVNASLYKRIQPLLGRFLGERLLLSGGVARNQALFHFLQGQYEEIRILPEASLNGAIGCCYYGATFVTSNHEGSRNL